jgi:signal transduction histidine kinase
MTIRTRLTLWYAGVLCASILVIGVVAYREFVLEKNRNVRSALKKAGQPDLEGPEEELRELREILLSYVLPSVALAVGGGWVLTRKALAPVAALTAAVGHIDERTVGQALPRTGNGDELDRLTEVFNDMTARLDDSFQRIRDFTLHASHELKTPLTVLHGELEAALQDPALPPAHRERCQTQLDEVQRLAAIADGLTLLTKADAGQVSLAREPVQFDDLVRDALDDALILARPHGVRVELAQCESLIVAGDRHRLRQLLLNLTDNAVKYNERGGSVTLALRRMGDAAELTVANTGPGIPPEKIARVCDRFFRADASHNNAVEGCGLGMSIVQWIVTAHGGTIRVRSLPEPLTTVTVRLPVAVAV